MFKWLFLGGKKMPKNSEGAMKTGSSRASKWAPSWYSCMVAPKSLSGQPLDQVWIRLARKGFWSYHTDIFNWGLIFIFSEDIYTRCLFKIRIFGPIPLVPVMMSLLGAVHKWHHFWLTKSPYPWLFAIFWFTPPSSKCNVIYWQPHTKKYGFTLSTFG